MPSKKPKSKQKPSKKLVKDKFYTFSCILTFTGSIVVVARSEDEAHEKCDNMDYVDMIENDLTDIDVLKLLAVEEIG